MARAAVAALGGCLGGLGDGLVTIVEEVEAVNLVEDGGVAGVSLELGVAGLDLAEEGSGGDCWRAALTGLPCLTGLPFLLFFLEDDIDDVAEGVVVDA